MKKLFAKLSEIQAVSTYAKTVICLTLFAIFSLPAKGVAQQKNSLIKKEVADTLLWVDGKAVIVEQEVWKLNEKQGSFDPTLKSYVLKDSADTSLFSKSFPEADPMGYGFNPEFDISLSVISTPEREALAIYHSVLPSAPGAGRDLQLFVWYDDDLVPISKPLSAYGKLGKIKHEGFDIPLADTETVLMTHHIAYHFYVNIPVVINLDPSVKNSYRIALKKDIKSGLKVIPVTAEARKSFMDDNPVEVTLYKSALGNQSVSVRVDRESIIKVGPAYGTVTVSESERGTGVSFEVKRLKVTIDGKTGFVEEKDYVKLGLPAFG